MADEALARAGLHFDELNKIRVLEPDVAQQTVELKEECKEFVDSKYMHNIGSHHYCFIQYEFLTDITTIPMIVFFFCEFLYI